MTNNYANYKPNYRKAKGSKLNSTVLEGLATAGIILELMIIGALLQLMI